MTPDPITLRLRSIRKAKGLTQRAAEETADLGTNVIARWERGYGVTLASVRQLANALGYDIVLVKLEGGPILTPRTGRRRKMPPKSLTPEHKRALHLGRDDFNSLRVGKGLCRNGHDLTTANALYVAKDGNTRCAECARAKVRRHAARRKVTSAGLPPPPQPSTGAG